MANMRLGKREVVAALGLACLLTTLQICSPTFTPFQEMPGLSSFVGSYVVYMHALVVVCVTAVAAFSIRLRRPLPRALTVFGGLAYLASNIALAALSWVGFTGSSLLLMLLAALAAAGCVLTCLAWGRLFGSFDARTSLWLVSLAACLQAALCFALMHVQGMVYTLLFCLVSAIAVAPVVASAVAPGNAGVAPSEAPPGGLARSATPAVNAERVRSFASVVGPALLGLLASAFVQGSMRGLVVDHYHLQLAAALAAALVLGSFALARTRLTFVQVAYRNLIPLLAVTLLAVMNIGGVLQLDRSLAYFMLHLLYVLAALLTLVTLSATAHAAEFESDLIFSVAIGLYSLLSIVGLQVGGAASDDVVMALVVVVTTVYAFAMVLPGMLVSHADSKEVDAGMPLSQEAVSEKPATLARDESAATWEQNLERRCEMLARQHALTAREAEILKILAQGHGSAYIAETLFISQNTVRSHVHNLYGKLGVSSREELMRLAREAVA